MYLTQNNSVMNRIARFFSASRRPAATKTIATPRASKLGLEALEVRDCPTTFMINHPAIPQGDSYSAVSGSLFGPNGPSYRDVNQGAEGDCWLISSLAEVAARDPADIRSMFTYEGMATENGATVGIYNVRLYNQAGVPNYVLVDTELPSGGNLYDHPLNGVLWVALAEKAYAQANGAGIVSSSHPGIDSYDALGNLDGSGGDAKWALQAITGQRAADYNFNSNNLAAAWNSGEFIVLGTPQTPNSPYIVGDHDYALVGYNPSSSQPFTVLNPWGTNSSGWALGTDNGRQVYGLFTASAGFLSQNYTSESFGLSVATGVTYFSADVHQVSALGNGPNATTAPAPKQTTPSVSDAIPVQFANRVSHPDSPLGTVVTGMEFASYETDLAVWVD